MPDKILGGLAAAVTALLLCCAGLIGAVIEGGGSDGTSATGICDISLNPTPSIIATPAQPVTTADASARPYASASTATASPDASGSPQVAVAPSAGWKRIGPWDTTQVANAATIVDVGAGRGIPIRGWVIAVATAMQESSLHNYGNLGPRNDHDSLGLFQQRPSQGWGTPAQVMDPVYASNAFYTHLLRIKNWQSLPLTVAAQDVQRSAFPNAYAKWEGPADTLIAAITGLGTIVTSCGDGQAVSDQGWTQPVNGPITSGFRTPQRPDHDGVDIAVPEGTPIRAASDGTVVAAGCDARTAAGAKVSCDQDGNTSLVGLGWYVTIRHDGGITTTYGHQLQAPAVDIDEPVTAGQVIGESGSSGDSSGPHLYFKIVTLGGPVDPVPFMAAHGAPLSS